MGLFHIYLVPLRRVLLVVLSVTPFLMAGTAADGRASLAGVPFWDIKSTRKTHVPVIIVLTISLDVPTCSLSHLLIGLSLDRWRLPSKCCRPLIIPSPSAEASLANLASSPRPLKSWRWSCGCGRWPWWYGCICCHWRRGVVAGCWGWWCFVLRRGLHLKLCIVRLLEHGSHCRQFLPKHADVASDLLGIRVVGHLHGAHYIRDCSQAVVVVFQFLDMRDGSWYAYTGARGY